MRKLLRTLYLYLVNKQIEKRYWNSGKKLFCNFVKNNQVESSSKEVDVSIAVWVCPWCGTSIPWYNMVIAMLFKTYGCRNVTIIVNDIFDEKKAVSQKDYKESKDIVKVINKYKGTFENIDILYLSDVENENYTNEKRLYKYAYDNMIIQLGNSFFDESYKESVTKEWRDTLGLYAGRISKLFRKERWDRVIIPGGIYRESGILFDEIIDNDMDAITMDCGADIIQIAHNGFAGACGDAKEIVDILVNSGDVEELYSIAKEGHYKRRYRIKDEKSPIDLQYQNVAMTDNSDDEKKTDIVLFTNLEHEISANGKHCVFKDDKDWICSTVDFILNKTPYSITVREHPMWREFPETGLKSCLDKWSNNERFCFVSCVDTVSSYELIEQSKVVLVSASTIGLEAVMMGRHVVMETSAYYSDEHFVDKCITLEQYFERIVFYLGNKTLVTDAQKKQASLFYYVTQYLLFVKGEFVPVSPNYDRWISKSIRVLMEEDEINCFLRSVVEGIPYAYLYKPKLNE